MQTLVKQWFDINVFDYSIRNGNYYHLPLEKKIEQINEIKDKTNKIISVCEDEDKAYEYWKNNFNPKDDCCNLRIA